MLNRIFSLSGSERINTTKLVEFLEYIILGLIAFCIPLFFQQPQLLVGSLVNFCLVMAAIRIGGMAKNLSLVLIPGISALLGGALFGASTPFLVWLLPAVWAGNFLLLTGIKYLVVCKKYNFFLSLVAGAGAKAALIFAATFILNRFGIVPQSLLAAMSLIQLATALAGGTAAWGFHKSLEHWKRKA